MNQEEFDKVLAMWDTYLSKLFDAKGNEYARGDRLSNFKKAAAVLNGTPESALRGFLVKHLVSIFDMIDDLDSGVHHPMEKWMEKLGDNVAYLILLSALITERIQNGTPRGL